MHPKMCPVCKRLTLTTITGEYDSEGAKLEPDESYCSSCGFRHSEHVKHPMSERAEEYIETIVDKWVEILKVLKEV